MLVIYGKIGRKIIGSYFGDALTSSMIAPHDDEGYDLENLLRA